MNYLERLRTIKKEKEAKKVFVIEDTKEICVAKEAKEVTSRIPGVPVHVGNLIAWHWHGTEQLGTVDFLHGDPDGQTWAFVTRQDGSWCAVNMKFPTVLKGKGT